MKKYKPKKYRIIGVGMDWFNSYMNIIRIDIVLGIITTLISFIALFTDINLYFIVFVFLAFNLAFSIFLYNKINNLDETTYHYIYIRLARGYINSFVYMFLISVASGEIIISDYASLLLKSIISIFIWFLPNYIYFKKREKYFSPQNTSNPVLTPTKRLYPEPAPDTRIRAFVYDADTNQNYIKIYTYDKIKASYNKYKDEAGNIYIFSVTKDGKKVSNILTSETWKQRVLEYEAKHTQNDTSTLT